MIPEILYGKHTGRYSVETRYGSAKMGACLVVVRFREMAPAYLWQIGRLGVSYGVSGGVEAGLAELSEQERGPYRIFYRRSGRALAVNWGGRKA